MKRKVFFLILLFSLILSSQTFSQWSIQQLATTSNLNDIDFTSVSTGWVTGNSLALFKTTNGGLNWVAQTAGMTAGNYYTLSFLNSSVGYLGGTRTDTSTTSLIYKTVNGGISWTQKLTALNHQWFTSFFLDTNTGWFGGAFNISTGAIVKTVNGGTNWTTEFSNQFSPIKSIYFVDANTGYAGGYNIFLKSTTGGISWLNMSTTYNVNSLYFVDVNNGWMGDMNGVIRRTSNSGYNWIPQYTIPGGNTFTTLSFININTGWFATDKGAVFKTTNSGATWTAQETGSIYGINKLSFPTAFNGFGACNLGYILSTTNGGGNYSSITNIYRRNNVNKPIIFGQTTLDTLTVYVPATFSPNEVMTDVNFGIDTIINTIDSNLTITLTHLTYFDTIVYRAGGTGSNFIGTILNDSAAIPIKSGFPPFTGAYRPYKPLYNLNNLSPYGRWIIGIRDAANLDRGGVIKAWSVGITYNSPIAVNNITTEIPKSYKLYQNYPNPFNPNTNIKFSIMENGKWKNDIVILKVYDLLGKEIATLVNEKLQLGTYEIDFNGEKLSTGIYFYKLTTGDYSETKKMILLK